MEEFLWRLLFFSLCMSIPGLFLLLGQRFLKKRYRPAWRYRFWIFLFAGFLAPFLPEGLDFWQRSGGALLPIPKMELSAKGISAGTGILLLWIWLLGAAGVFGKTIYEKCFFSKSIKRLSAGREQAREEEILQRTMAQLKIRKKVTLQISPGTITPMVAGLFRPTIYLPEESYTDQELTLVYRHELYHVKQHDMAIQLLFCFCHAIHWFNPLLRLFLTIAQRECELSCDENAVKGLSIEEKKEYCRLLLKSASCQSSKTLWSAGFSDYKKELKERMEELLERTSKKKGFSVAAGLILCILVLGSVKISVEGVWFRTNLLDSQPVVEETAVVYYQEP